uniref:NADH-ubiquinone oxidoreductase chain 6 n=1 Tax=Lyssa zampa TaxID=655071 RepID=A0A8A6KH56_9NEOP|nr:NADH dehydrogenase subunit 6 [Lyssa zampa]QTI83033.1 NADH dehydrogenase subunit 6 [Lyssa zampa]UNP54439.1 NADH dehydrogenase subunit 6 [Lyssa zampa]
MKMFISLMMMMMSMLMFFLNHPLSMGLMILIQTLMTCLISGMMIKTYWFSYILFLTFLGGLLVLFIYVCSVASNELFKINLNMKITILLLTMMIMFMQLIFFNNLNWMNFNNNMEMNMFFNLMFLNNENKINLNKLYNNQTYLIMILMIIYLFITLIATVKITNIFYGPLRSIQ